MVQLAAGRFAEALLEWPLADGILHILEKHSGTQLSESPGRGSGEHHRAVRPDSRVRDGTDLRAAVRAGEAVAEQHARRVQPDRGRLAVDGQLHLDVGSANDSAWRRVGDR